MFKKLFGTKETAAPVRSSPAAATNTINTIQQLNETEEQLEKRKELLMKKMEAELEKAKEFTRQKKQQSALMCLKRKKLIETEIGNVDNMILRVLEQRSMLESQRTTLEVVSTVHSAAQAAKENMKAMKIENVDKVIEDISEVNDHMRQIQEVIGQPMGAAADIDEDELLNELNELEEHELDNELLQPAHVPAHVPAVTGPSEKVPQKTAAKVAEPVKKKTDEELELEALEAELA